VKLCTLGGFFIFQLIDIVLIASGVSLWVFIHEKFLGKSWEKKIFFSFFTNRGLGQPMVQISSYPFMGRESNESLFPKIGPSFGHLKNFDFSVAS
jgi:hypothetical protein